MASVTSPLTDFDTAGLARTLAARCSGEVRFDAAYRRVYSTDASNYRQLPLGVVLPKTADDVIAAIATCREFNAPVLPRGGGTSLSGQTCNVAVVIDLSKHMNRVLEIDPDRRLARVQPGAILDDLREAAEEHHLTFGPDPATHSRCTLGGMIGNNSCGVHSVMAGKTDANVIALDVLSYRGVRMDVTSLSEEGLEGAVARGGPTGALLASLRDLRQRYVNEIRSGFTDIPRRVSGFDLPHLLPEKGFNLPAALVGVEGTCVTVLEATLKLVSSPPGRSLLVLAYPDVFAAADAVMEILEFEPIGLEGMDDRLMADLRARRMHASEVDLLPRPAKGPGGWLLVEFGGDTERESRDRADKLMDHLKLSLARPATRLCQSGAEAKRLWEVREAALGAGALVPGRFMRWPGWDDSAVAPRDMSAYLRDLQKLMDRYEYDGAFYGHFGEGCLHVRYNFDLRSEDGIKKYRGFLCDAADLVVSYGGSLSGEHGDGQSHGELLNKMFTPELMRAFREFKAIWDPDGKMNPGKVIEPLPLDRDLRLKGYGGRETATVFEYPDDGGQFSNAVLRCVGVGKCRQHDAGTMCPSYIATRDEMHSTRGRARLLFEMVRDGPKRNGWRDQGVRESLDLCLACKACKSECPVGVDMATYKAEFLSHHYRGRVRPRAAYSMGLIHWWARLASVAPGSVNGMGRAPVLAAALKWAAGVSPRRTLPPFAPTTFKRRFRNRAESPGARRTRVVLWPDTFNNHFHPEVAMAAAEVLEACGFHVVVPEDTVCCGRPLYDFGMLDLARHLLRRTLQVLHDEIQEGTPLVVLEPSCASVFRDELVNLFPRDESARRMSDQTFLLPDFLELRASRHTWKPVGGLALVQGHCHQQSIFDMKAETSLLNKLGIECDLPDAGCCGMAGAFGFDREHYEVSVAIGERGLLPAVRRAPEETLILADGFSCREQIRQLAGRQPVHVAEVLGRAI